MVILTYAHQNLSWGAFRFPTNAFNEKRNPHDPNPFLLIQKRNSQKIPKMIPHTNRR